MYRRANIRRRNNSLYRGREGARIVLRSFSNCPSFGFTGSSSTHDAADFFSGQACSDSRLLRNYRHRHGIFGYRLGRRFGDKRGLGGQYRTNPGNEAIPVRFVYDKLEGPRNGNGRSNPQFFERGRLYDVKQRAKKGITKWRRK